MNDTISRQAATKHLKHRLYETAMNNDDLSGVFVEIAEHRIETWIGEVPSAEPSVITMRVDIDKEQFAKAWKQALASSPLTVFPDEELDTGLYVDGFDDGFKAGTQRWIPVTERLPEEGVMVLVTCYGRDMIIMRDGESLEDAIERVRKEVVNVTVGLVGSDGWYGADYSPMIITPAAWMPLPEPYKEEEDGTTA